LRWGLRYLLALRPMSGGAVLVVLVLTLLHRSSDSRRSYADAGATRVL